LHLKLFAGVKGLLLPLLGQVALLGRAGCCFCRDGLPAAAASCTVTSCKSLLQRRGAAKPQQGVSDALFDG
jgi:hypothetical protein